MNWVVTSNETETLWHIGWDLPYGHQIPTPPTSSDVVEEEECVACHHPHAQLQDNKHNCHC
jgi:hypothetical protein